MVYVLNYSYTVDTINYNISGKKDYTVKYF